MGMLKFVFIINTLFFSVSFAFLIFEIWKVVGFLIATGSLYNIWCFFKYCGSTKISPEKFLGGLDRVSIMEDLDREAERRREVEKLNRN
jgi:hypothetical protein